MDAIHYDKIADKLIQFHSKLPYAVDLEQPKAKEISQHIRYRIEYLLKAIDELAEMDEKGWIR